MSKHTVTVTLETIISTDFPGIVSKEIQVSLNGPTLYGPVTLTDAPYVAKFSEVETGEYQVSAQAIGPDGSPLGTPIVSACTISPDISSVVLPSGISVKVD